MKLLIVSHGPLAGAMKESARMFFGETCDQIGTLELYPADSPDKLMLDIVDYVRQAEEDVLIFVDIIAGSPYNMTALAIEELKGNHHVECFTGVNMPILMETLGMMKSESLAYIINHIEAIAPDTITNLRKGLDI